MSTILILNGTLINEGQKVQKDIFIKEGRIDKIDGDLSSLSADKIIDAAGQYVIPGAIDDQVHFREPGLTHKAEIFTESRAAVAGGVTSFMEMPNTKPQAVTQELLADKYAIAAEKSLANYSFFMGSTNENIEEVLKTNPEDVCGVKIFMGSSTGNMLVDDEKTLDNIFSKTPMLIATHCEKEEIVRANEELYRRRYGDDINIGYHPDIRSVDACYQSSSMAIELAKKHGIFCIYLLHQK